MKRGTQHAEVIGLCEIPLQRMAIEQAELNAQTKVPCRFFVLNPSQAAQESNWQNLKAGTDYCEINTLNGTMQEQVHYAGTVDVRSTFVSSCIIC